MQLVLALMADLFFSNLVLCVTTLRVIASKEPIMMGIAIVMKDFALISPFF